MFRCCLSVLLCVVSSSVASASEPDEPFDQEIHVACPLPQAGSTQLTSDAVFDGGVALGTEDGLYLLNPKTNAYTPIDKEAAVFDLAATDSGGLLIADLNGLTELQGRRRIQHVAGKPVAVVAQRVVDGRRLTAALGPDGIWTNAGGEFEQSELSSSHALTDAVIDTDGSVWIGTGMGLTHRSDAKSQRYLHAGEIYSSAVRGVDIDEDGRVWAGSFGGITIYENGKPVQELTPANGLPTVYIQCLAAGPDGRIWIGTRHGVARRDGESWSCRAGRRWLLDDDVRDITFDSDGTAWIATRTGVSAIRRRQMTLEEKAQHFHEISEARHVRPPGIEEKVFLETPAHGYRQRWRLHGHVCGDGIASLRSHRQPRSESSCETWL